MNALKHLVLGVALVATSPVSAGTLKQDIRNYTLLSQRAHDFYDDKKDNVLVQGEYDRLVHAADAAQAALERHKPYCAYKNGSIGAAIGRCIGKRIYWLKPGSKAARYVKEAWEELEKEDKP